MSHHIYHTRGIILGSVPAGESNRSYKIFTEELGLVFGLAQSVREGKSKLRYTLQDFSFVTVDLVKGKEVWRIISAGVFRPLETIKNDPTKIKMFARVCAFVLRMVQGQWRDEQIFLEMIRIAEFLENWEIKKEQIPAFEALVALRMLVHLGYMDGEGYERFLSTDAYSEESLREMGKICPSILLKINEAMNASHL